MKGLFKRMNYVAVDTMRKTMSKITSEDRGEALNFKKVPIYGCSFVPSFCISIIVACVLP